MDSKGQDILFNSEMKQKDLMIQMLSERLDEKDETITELKETINDLKDTIAGLRETLDEFQRKLFGTGSEKKNRIRKRKKLWQQSSKATNGQHAKRKRHVKTSMEIFRSIRKSSPCRKKISIVLIVIPRWSM